MPLQYAAKVSHNLLVGLLEIFNRLPAPAAGALLILATICLYECLGNSRLAPGRWR